MICVRWDSVSYQATVASHLEPSLQILPVLTTPPVPVCVWELEEMCSLPKEEGLAHWLLQHLDIHNFPRPSVNYLWVSLLILEGDIPLWETPGDDKHLLLQQEHCSFKATGAEDGM